MKKEFQKRNCVLKDCAPLADELYAPIKAYSRALPWLACAGTLEKKDIKTIKNAGFKTVIDLRTAKEDKINEKSLFSAENISYTNLEVKASGITKDQLDRFIELVEKSEKPILVHCASSGRVGAMITLYHIKKNSMDIETAFELGRAANMPKWYEDIIRKNLKDIISNNKQDNSPSNRM